MVAKPKQSLYIIMLCNRGLIRVCTRVKFFFESFLFYSLPRMIGWWFFSSADIPKSFYHLHFISFIILVFSRRPLVFSRCNHHIPVYSPYTFVRIRPKNLSSSHPKTHIIQPQTHNYFLVINSNNPYRRISLQISFHWLIDCFFLHVSLWSFLFSHSIHTMSISVNLPLYG